MVYLLWNQLCFVNIFGLKTEQFTFLRQYLSGVDTAPISLQRTYLPTIYLPTFIRTFFYSIACIYNFLPSLIIKFLMTQFTFTQSHIIVSEAFGSRTRASNEIVIRQGSSTLFEELIRLLHINLFLSAVYIRYTLFVLANEPLLFKQIQALE